MNIKKCPYRPSMLAAIVRVAFPVLAIGLMFHLLTLDFANAQKKRNIAWVRDAEIETLMNDYARPLFSAGGLSKNAVEVFLLNREDFNAFVTGTRMFINIGAIMKSDTPNEIIGVLAHETGHIIRGHLTGLRDRLQKAQALAVLSVLAGAGAVAAGSTEAAGAIFMGSQQGIMRNLLAYQREDEVDADHTGVTLLDKTGQSSLGMINTFKRLSKNSLFKSSGLDPYAISHPLPRERVALLNEIAQKSPHFTKKDPPALQLRHDMARAKIAAFSAGPGGVRALFRNDLKSAPARYGYAISTYLSGSPKKGIEQLGRLVKEQPNNEFIYEIMGEMALKAGNVGAAVKYYSKAVSLNDRQNGLLMIQLGHSLLQTNNKANLEPAINYLKAGLSRDRYSSDGYGYMARAYAIQGKQNLAIAASAEQKFLQGNFAEAKKFALRAQPKVKTGSPQWLRLQDIIDYKPPKLR